MVIKPNYFNFEIVPHLVLNGKQLDIVKSYNYLGFLFNEKMSDNDDIKKHTRNIYARGNSIIRNFKNCSDAVKCELFCAFFTSLYCSLYSLHSKTEL
jgi:hypothetical protein